MSLLGRGYAMGRRAMVRTVQLVGWVDGEPVLGVTVRFTDIDPSGTYSPGHAVDVLEWTTCGGDACDGLDPP